MKKSLDLTPFVGKNLPYLYFILGTLFWFCMDLSESGQFNFIAFAILTMFIYQLVYKSHMLGLCLSSLIMVISFLMFFAVLSEFNDFDSATHAAMQLLTVGMFISCSAFIMAFILFKGHYQKSGSAE